MQRLISKHLKTEIHFSYVQFFISSLKGSRVYFEGVRTVLGKFVVFIVGIIKQRHKNTSYLTE